MWLDLAAACETIASDASVRVVVLSGTGDSFSAGGDFDDFAQMETLAERQGYLRDVLAAYAAYERLPIPTIAVVDGIAVGGGCELSVVSDIVIATERAQFALPEARVGLYPGVAVARAEGRISERTLDYMIYTGHVIDVYEAKQSGLVTRIVERDQLGAAVQQMAMDIAAQAPLAVRRAKAAAIAKRAAGAYALTAEEIPKLMTTNDHAEGLAAFSQRRPPRFEGT
jgi:enoyl-CoA hydratase